MDVRVEEVRPPLLRSRLPRRRRQATAVRTTPAAAAPRTEVEAAPRVAAFEWTIAIVVLFVMARLAVLFFRRQLAEAFGGPPSPLWQDDLVVTLAFAVAELAAIALAVWRARASALLRQPVLLALLGWAWLSTAWSVEPSVTARRVLLFIGAAGVGWFVGARFTTRDHMRLLSVLGGIAVVTTVIGLIVWNEAANGDGREWSGIFVNRNALALLLGMGLLATMILIRTTDRKRPLQVHAFVLFLFLGRTQSRTPLLAAGVALGVAWITYKIRSARGSVLRVGPAAYVVFATLGTIGLVVHWYWYEILRFFGRDPDLTGRTLIWQLVRWFSDLRPWTGWGFEAIWANRYAIGQAQGARGSLKEPIPGGWPFSAHNGYYELMVGIGRVGLALMVLFLAVTLWRAFRHAWVGRDAVSLWPLSFVLFAVVMNFSESLFVSSETLWAMTVATAIALTEHDRLEETSLPVPERMAVRERARRLLAFRLD